MAADFVGFFVAQVEKAEEGKGYDVNLLMVDRNGNLVECGMRTHFRTKKEAEAFADLQNNGDGGQDEFTPEELEALE